MVQFGANATSIFFSAFFLPVFLWSRTRVKAELFWQQWYFWATHCRLRPVKKAARMIHNHLDNVLTHFHHRITNAVSEGLNSKLQTVKKTPMGIATVPI